MTVLAINVAMYFVSAVLSKDPMNMDTNVLSVLGASQRERLWEGEWIRLIAPMFLHGGLLHILMNMYFLWQAGPDAEIFFGTPNFGTIYLLSGVSGICLSQIFGGHLSIGASTSLCGIMGAALAVEILKTPVRRYAWRSSRVRAVAFNLILLLLIGVFGGFNMDNWGHFGGMLAGFLLGGSFELWREHKVIGKVGVFATIACVATLVCAARWTVFNPTYHIYEVACAKEEDKDPVAEKEHAAEARRWAGVWTPLHFMGVLNTSEADALLQAYELHKWNRNVALDPRISMLQVQRAYRRGNLKRDLIAEKRQLDDLLSQ